MRLLKIKSKGVTLISFILTIILGLIFCLPMIWVAKLKTEINILNDKLEFYREKALYNNHLYAFLNRGEEYE